MTGICGLSPCLFHSRPIYATEYRMHDGPVTHDCPLILCGGYRGFTMAAIAASIMNGFGYRLS